MPTKLSFKNQGKLRKNVMHLELIFIKSLLWLKIIFLLQYIFIAILCVKMSSV